ncbi:hypothetical protein RZN25_13020 [Bacillaceae bacterium S4-13-56]
MKNPFLLMLIATLTITLSGCNFIEKQMEEQKSEKMIEVYYQSIIDENYEKAFQQLYLYDYDPEKTNQNKSNGTNLSKEEAKEFYLKKIEFLKNQNYKLTDFEIEEVEYADGHTFWHHIKLEVEQNGKKIEWSEVADIYEEKLLVSSKGDPYVKYRDGKMNFEIE